MNAIDEAQRYLESRQRELGGHERELESAALCEHYELEVIRVAGLIAGALAEAGEAAQERIVEGDCVVQGMGSGYAAFVRRSGIEASLQRVLDVIADAAAPSP